VAVEFFELVSALFLDRPLVFFSYDGDTDPPKSDGYFLMRVSSIEIGVASIFLFRPETQAPIDNNIIIIINTRITITYHHYDYQMLGPYLGNRRETQHLSLSQGTLISAIVCWTQAIACTHPHLLRDGV